MNREKIGLIIVLGCCLILLAMFLMQLPDEIDQATISSDTTSPYINDNVYTERFIPIQNVSYSDVNATYYVVAGGGGASGYYPHMVTK